MTTSVALITDADRHSGGESWLCAYLPRLTRRGFRVDVLVARSVSPFPHWATEKALDNPRPDPHAEMHGWRPGRVQKARCGDLQGWNSLLSSASN